MTSEKRRIGGISSFVVGVILRVEEIVAGISAHGNGGGDAGGGDAGNRGDFAEDFLIHADDLFVVLDLRLGNKNVEGLDLIGLTEAGIDVG